MSAERGIAAVEADLVAHVSLLYAPPFGEVHEESGSVWVATGIADPGANGVLRAVIEGDPDERVTQLMQPFKTRSLPMMWWSFTSLEGADRDLHAALVAQGMTLASDRPAMTLELPDRQPTEQQWPVERVRTEAQLELWSAVVGQTFGIADHFHGLSGRSFLRYGFEDDAPFRHYLVVDGSQPVGAATLSVAAGVSGLGNIATLPSRRRRGVASAAVTAALRDAQALGLEIGALSADPAGDRLYRKFGFLQVGHHLTYEWVPRGMPAG